jgi:AraC-like DNA-binding protein
MFTPPPPHSARFRSDHLDEIHAFVATYDGSHRRAALGPGPLGYSIHAVRCGEVDLGWGRTRVRQAIRGVPQGAILHVPLRRRHVYTLNDSTLEARPDTAVFLAPGQDYTLYFEPEDCLVVLRMPAAALAEELANRDPARTHPGLGTREIPLAGGRLRTLAALQGMLVAATTPATGHAPPPRACQLDAQLCSWMADQLLGTRAAGSALVHGIRRIRNVEAWIDGHLAEPITLGRLCAVAGVGDRYLESAFRAHRGQTPMQFVMARRLAAVRRNLLEPAPGRSVTQLAHDAGFIHLGRFAARYRGAYGEPPSATLRRSHSRC